MADVSIINCTVCQQFNKRKLLLLLLPHGFFINKLTGEIMDAASFMFVLYNDKPELQCAAVLTIFLINTVELTNILLYETRRQSQ